MKGSLYINDELVSENIYIPLYFQTNDLNDLTDKRAGRSATVILEKTEFLHENSTIWNSEILATYKIGSVILFRNGKCRVNKFTSDEVHLTIYYGAILLTNLLQNLKLNELEDGSMFAEWNSTNILNTDSSDDFCFIFCNPMSREIRSWFVEPFGAQWIMPAVSVRKIISMIEATTEIQITGDFATDPLIDKLFMPLQTNLGSSLSDITAGTNEVARNDNDRTLNEIYTKMQSAGSVVPGVYNQFIPLRFDNVYKGIVTDNYKFSVVENGTFNMKISMEIETYHVFATSGTLKYYLFLTKNWDGTLSNLAAATVRSSFVEIDLDSQDNFLGEYELKVGGFIPAVTTDVFQISLLINIQITTAPYLLEISGVFTDACSLEVTQDFFNYGSNIDFCRNLPDISALDFLKSLIQKKGFLLDYDDLNEQFIINYYETLYKNISIANDWSKKIVKDSWELVDIYGVAAQNNYFEYTNEDVLKDLGKHTYFINKEVLPFEVLLLKDPTAATEMQSLKDFDNAYNAVEIPLLELISENKYEFNKINPRFLIVETESATEIFGKKIQVAEISGGTFEIENVNNAYFQRADKIDSLHFDILAEKYYVDFKYTIANFRKYTALFSLTAADVVRNQTVPIFVKGLGYFHVQKIDFVPDGISNVELIKI